MEPILQNAWIKAGLTPAHILPWETCRPFSDLTGAWPAETGIVRYHRTAFLSGYRTEITDCLTLSDAKPVTWHLLCAEKPEVTEHTLSFPIAGCTATLCGGELAVTVEEVPLTDSKLQNEWRTTALWRVCVRCERWTDGVMTVSVRAL